jgi:Fe-S oxidoreductase
MFNPDSCTECGACLMHCPSVQYTTEKAVAEVRALKQGLSAGILPACITCMACNEYCPNEADPFDRICRLQERYGVRLVTEDRAEQIEAMLASVPKRIVAGDTALPALSLCVMEHALPPNMADSLLFENLTVVSGSPYYSRVVHLHTGMPSLTREHAAGFIKNLALLGRQEIVFAHDDCYVLAAVLAPAYGVAVPFTPVHLAEWLGRVLAEKNSRIRKLDKKIAFQRPCISRIASWTDRYIDRVFDLIGIERVKRCYDRANARCCGIGLMERFPDASTGMVAENMADALLYGAEAMVFGCPSCYAFMSEACMAAGLSPVFITDLARMALGEIPFEPRPHIKKDAA